VQKYLFVLPAFALFAVFVLVPLGASFYYGFMHWDGLTAPHWAGLANYMRAFRDSIYLRSYVHVSLYVLGTLVVEVAFGLFMAVLLESNRPGFSLFRVLCFSPMVMSLVAAGLLWAFVYDLRFGLLNAFLEGIGLGGLAQAWLANPKTALAAVTIVSGWRFSGFYMVIFLAALKRIPASLREAAMLDGAGGFQLFFRITLPLLRETVMVAVLLAVAEGLSVFDLFYTMTNGQPFNATEVPATWIIKQAFDHNQMGYGVALTVLMLFAVGIISLLYLRLTRSQRVTEY
jgi:ABC-type sugar transport system permease subunit